MCVRTGGVRLLFLLFLTYITSSVANIIPNTKISSKQPTMIPMVAPIDKPE